MDWTTNPTVWWLIGEGLWRLLRALVLYFASPINLIYTLVCLQNGLLMSYVATLQKRLRDVRKKEMEDYNRLVEIANERGDISNFTIDALRELSGEVCPTCNRRSLEILKRRIRQFNDQHPKNKLTMTGKDGETLAGPERPDLLPKPEEVEAAWPDVIEE